MPLCNSFCKQRVFQRAWFSNRLGLECKKEYQIMRFHTELDSSSNRWLVFDAANHVEIVGVHVSGTFAALDAMKREQEIFKSKFSRPAKPKADA